MARKKGIPQRAGLSRAEFEQVKALSGVAFEEEQRDEEERRRAVEHEERKRADEHVKRIRAAAEERTRSAHERGASCSLLSPHPRPPAHPHLTTSAALNSGAGLAWLLT